MKCLIHLPSNLGGILLLQKSFMLFLSYCRGEFGLQESCCFLDKHVTLDFVATQYLVVHEFILKFYLILCSRPIVEEVIDFSILWAHFDGASS